MLTVHLERGMDLSIRVLGMTLNYLLERLQFLTQSGMDLSLERGMNLSIRVLGMSLNYLIESDCTSGER